MCQTWVASAWEWAGIILMPIPIRIWNSIDMEIWMWIRIGINTMLIHNTGMYRTSYHVPYPTNYRSSSWTIVAIVYKQEDVLKSNNSAKFYAVDIRMQFFVL
jgi:hypothetical protein